jgi:colanic acid/amylovoran biosynthesis glycosyltransferase
LLPTIGHIKDNFLPRSEAFVYALITGLSGCRPIVLDRHRRQNENTFPFAPHFSPVARFNKAAGFLERATLRLWGRSLYLEHVLRIENVHLLHAHFGQLGALFVPVARRLGLPLVTSFYGTDVSVFARNPKWRARFLSLWEYGSRFLAVGPRMADRLTALGCPAERLSVLPLCLDVQQFAYQDRAVPDDGQPVNILSAGRLIRVKGMDVLLHAAAALETKRPVRLWIAGDGPERAALETLSRDLGVESMTTFPGWIDHSKMSALMDRAHLFVLASRADDDSGQIEGTPTVLLEAMAMGLPVVSTIHGDIPSIVRNGSNGMLVREGDAGALANALTILVNNPARWPRMGKAGRSDVEAVHGKEAVAGQLMEIYQSCLSDAEVGRYQ